MDLATVTWQRYFPLVKACVYSNSVYALIILISIVYTIFNSQFKTHFHFCYSFISYYKVWVPLIQNYIVLCISRIASRICHGIVFSPTEGGCSSSPDSCFSGLYILLCRRLQTPWSLQDQQPARQSTVWSEKNKKTKKEHIHVNISMESVVFIVFLNYLMKFYLSTSFLIFWWAPLTRTLICFCSANSR